MVAVFLWSGEGNRLKGEGSLSWESLQGWGAGEGRGSRGGMFLRDSAVRGKFSAVSRQLIMWKFPWHDKGREMWQSFEDSLSFQHQPYFTSKEMKARKSIVMCLLLCD